jgi:hypothetical protein
MEADARQIEIYRRMRPDQKVALACGLHDFAHQRVLLYLRRLHPEKTEREILVEAAVRFCGESAAVLREGGSGANASTCET